jgi:hypothetical protein
MRSERARSAGAFVIIVLLGRMTPLYAQGVEIAPLGGYRIGGDLFEIAAARPLDDDGAPAVGVVVDVPLHDGMQLEASFSHQQLDVLGPIQPLQPASLWRISVDQWQVGGLQEYGGAKVRPFATGLLGLTRYALEADSEVRFMVSAGGGVKIFPVSHLGVRLDGRVFATFVDASASTVLCAGGCVARLHVSVAWQAEFTAGLVVRLR